MRKLLEKWEIFQVWTAAYHSKSNGLVEKTIGTLKKVMEYAANGDLSERMNAHLASSTGISNDAALENWI